MGKSSPETIRFPNKYCVVRKFSPLNPSVDSNGWFLMENSMKMDDDGDDDDDDDDDDDLGEPP